MNDPSQMPLFISLFVIAFLLIGAEIYVPGGVLGIMGAICLSAAVFIGFSMSPLMGWASLLAVLAFCIAGLLFWFLYFPRSPAGRRLTLDANGAGFKIDLPAYASLVGARGVTSSPLRPSGVAEIGDRRHDVVAEDGVWIESGVAVVVSRVSGNRIYVLPENGEPEPGAGTVDGSVT